MPEEFSKQSEAARWWWLKKRLLKPIPVSDLVIVEELDDFEDRFCRDSWSIHARGSARDVEDVFSIEDDLTRWHGEWISPRRTYEIISTKTSDD